VQAVVVVNVAVKRNAPRDDVPLPSSGDGAFHQQQLLDSEHMLATEVVATASTPLGSVVSCSTLAREREHQSKKQEQNSAGKRSRFHAKIFAGNSELPGVLLPQSVTIVVGVTFRSGSHHRRSHPKSSKLLILALDEMR